MIDPTPSRVSQESESPNPMMGGGLNLSVFACVRYKDNYHYICFGKKNYMGHE